MNERDAKVIAAVIQLRASAMRAAALLGPLTDEILPGSQACFSSLKTSIDRLDKATEANPHL